MDLQDFLNFRRMVTPLIIKILFWVGVGISVLLGVGSVLGGVIRGISNDSLVAVAGGLCTGPLIIVVGILSVRIYSELLILAFQIHDTLVDIKNQLAQR